jgi:integrase
MATFTKLASGSWRVQVRRKGRYISETFLRREDARIWAQDSERDIDRGATPQPSRIARKNTFGDLIDLHIEDMKEVGKAPGRSKAATLDMLKRELGKKTITELDRAYLVKFGRTRARQDAGPVTLSMDIGAIRLVLSHAAAVHGLSASVEPVDQARIALKRLGLVGKSNERDRRPTEDELTKLFKDFDENERLTIPMARIVKFAIATAMRQEEICRVTWDDLNTRTKMIRDRKDPREKKGNDQRIPLLKVSGYDALALIEEQRELRTNAEGECWVGRRAGLRTMRGVPIVGSGKSDASHYPRFGGRSERNSTGNRHKWVCGQVCGVGSAAKGLQGKRNLTLFGEGRCRS